MPLIQPVQQPNIAQLIMQGLGAARQFQGLQREERRGEREDELFDLSRQIATNPQDAVAIRRRDMLDPEGAAARKKQAFDQQKFQFEKERFDFDRQSAEQKSFSLGEYTQAGKIIDLPIDGQIRSLEKYAMELGKSQSPLAKAEITSTQQLIGALKSGDPQAVTQAQEMIKGKVQGGQRLGILKTPGGAGQELAIVRKVKALRDPSLSEVERGYILADLAGQQQRIEVNPDGSISVVTGKDVGAGIQKKTTTDIEKKLVSAEENILNLNRIEQQFKPDYLTYLGRGKAFISSIKSKAGGKLSEEERSFMGGRRKFTENINRFFNQYRKEITGAAASVQELSSLKKAMFNEDLSPAEFEASFNEFKSSVLRNQRLHRKLLRDGVRGNFKNKKSQAAKRLDQLHTSGADDSVLDRINDLKEKKSEAEMLEILQNEGYSITP